MEFYLDGLERSGNVYLSYAISLSTGINLNSLRTHNIETLKNYKGSDPFIVPVRDALESISSARVFRKYVFDNKMFNDMGGTESELDNIVRRYKEYTDYLVKNEKFFIAPFHEFTKDHMLVINKMIKFYSNLYDIKIIDFLNKEDIFLKIEKQHKDQYSHHPQLGNFPREDNEEKYQIRELLLKQYRDDTEHIQSNINLLYKRYEAI